MGALHNTHRCNNHVLCRRFARLRLASMLSLHLLLFLQELGEKMHEKAQEENR
jgi:hypothetical protein